MAAGPGHQQIIGGYEKIIAAAHRRRLKIFGAGLMAYRVRSHGGEIVRDRFHS
jgi:hypothetical protein